MVVLSTVEFIPCPFHSLPLFLTDIIKNGNEWTRKLEKQRAPSVDKERRAFLREHDLSGVIEREWAVRTALGEEVAWSGVWEPDCVRRVCVCAGWECLGGQSPKNIRRGSSSRDPGVPEPRCGGRSVHIGERVMTATKRLFTRWGINQRSNHVKGRGEQISPHHRREETK